MTDRIHIQEVLTDLHRLAENNRRERQLAMEQITDARDRKIESAKLKGNAYLAISPEQGAFLYLAARSIQAKHIVEFGCSFGISTIYLAWAADHSNGTVTTTELESQKWDHATRNWQRAELDHRVTLLQGDALDTLKNVTRPVDLLFLDGEKSLYLPVYQLLESNLHAGSMIIADNVEREGASDFVSFIEDHPERFISAILFEGRVMQVLVV